MARESIVGEKSLAFAKRIAKCYRYLNDKKKETVMSKQILRCGTSIGAKWHRADYMVQG
jgi:four helix bundle protein